MKISTLAATLFVVALLATVAVYLDVVGEEDGPVGSSVPYKPGTVSGAFVFFVFVMWLTGGVLLFWEVVSRMLKMPVPVKETLPVQNTRS